MASGGGAGNAVLGWVWIAGSSTSTTTKSCPSSRDRRSALVIAATGAASASTNPIRAPGCPGSSGTYAAPVFKTANIATTASADRDNNSATHLPGPAPWPASRCANRLAASSSSRYVIERPSKVNANPSGTRATWAANNAGTDTDAGSGWVNTARLPQTSSRACSPSSSTSIDDNRRVGSSVIATNT